MTVAKLTKSGVERVLSGAAGMTFVVDDETPSPRGAVVHVRDYRYPESHKGFQVWSLAPGQYELISD